MSTPGLETGLENTFARRVCSINANEDTSGTYAAVSHAHFRFTNSENGGSFFHPSRWPLSRTYGRV
ncbi:MAG: hypothetical protein ACRDU7_07490, partial [Acidimicrobiia bacterium]